MDSLEAARMSSRPDRVDALAGPAIAVARADADTIRLLPLLLMRGSTRSAFGQARPAEDDLNEAYAMAETRADTASLLRAIRWLSVSVGQQGRGTEAATLYRDLENLAHAAGDSLHLGWAWVGLAFDHYLNGRTHAAVVAYGQAAALLERQGEPGGAMWAWNGQGLALRQSGRYREARAALEHVLALAEAQDQAINQAIALNYLGRLDLQLGDPGAAVERFSRAADIHRAHQHHREGLLPSIDIAQARIMQGRYAEAEAALDSVITVCRELGLRDLEILAVGNLVDVRLEQGRPGAAVALCREMLVAGEMPSILNDTETRLRLARALADRDSLPAAVAVLEGVLARGAGSVSLELRSSALLGSLLVDAGRCEQAVAVLRPAFPVAREAGADAECVILLTHLGRAEAACDRPDSSLAAYRRAMACWERVRAWPSDPVWREHRGTVAGSLFAQAAATLLAVSDDPAHLAEAWNWVQRHKARTLQERMRGPDAASPADGLPGLEEFQQEILAPGEVFIDLVEGERVGVLFCVTTDTAFAGLLPGRASTRPRMERLGDVVTSLEISSPLPAENLANALVELWPLEARRLAAAATLVLWSPDGSWHGFPASLLSWDAGLARVPAAGVLVWVRTAPEIPLVAARVLAVCGPDPEGTDLLPGAAAEARWLSAHLRDVQTVGDKPGPPLDATDWNQADVLHLAAHTVLDPWQPWNTTITLGRGGVGDLKAAEVAELPLAARLAVLAGCTTAGNRLVGGEGLIGLAGAFLAARTPVVLATLWPVDDAVAKEITTGFYDGLADGLPAAMALARARGDHRVGQAPRDWAAFVLVGDGQVEVPVRRRTPRWPWALLLAALAIFALVRARR